ncbi:hypothetical protein BOTBODRAFT_190580 [Botryobasidium botryosum FD-172 SS1]|uniref:Phytanoyl-CoA dioxygenase family protein n=1 Tax=Botryobasidium botryosum (strain FD-172 SS1) TaxID=930990 RepID=A0A067MEE4_BOTB1|nr:hypothetical protein BOTBODRAFT_190580 [Botryobasidium botryosum FD-172 SS1]
MTSDPEPPPAFSLKLKQQYDTHGYVIVPNLIPDPTTLNTLRAACARAIDKTRRGEWTRRRTVGKQFPPYDADNPDSWGVQHVMHPALGEPAFAEWYASDALLTTAMGLLGCEEGDLQMELFNLLINPETHAFALRWHRDDVREDATEDEERAALAITHYGVQWNTALYEGACLFIVPGTHHTPRTPAQRALSSSPDPPSNPLDMPGAIQVILHEQNTPSPLVPAGETVFYNNNILHCATYTPTSQRATLHACIGDATRSGASRARNILQHDLAWMHDWAFGETLPGRLVPMWRRLVEMAGSVDGRALGYSLEG